MNRSFNVILGGFGGSEQSIKIKIKNKGLLKVEMQMMHLMKKRIFGNYRSGYGMKAKLNMLREMVDTLKNGLKFHMHYPVAGRIDI